MQKLLELFSASLIDDDAVLFRQTLRAEHKSLGDPVAGTVLPSVVTDAGVRPYAKDSRANVMVRDQKVFSRIFQQIRIVKNAGKPRPTGARCKNRPKKRADGISHQTSLGEIITADQEILSLDDESRKDHWNALIVQDGILVLVAELSNKMTKNTRAKSKGHNQRNAQMESHLLPHS